MTMPGPKISDDTPMFSVRHGSLSFFYSPGASTSDYPYSRARTPFPHPHHRPVSISLKSLGLDTRKNSTIALLIHLEIDSIFV